MKNISLVLAVLLGAAPALAQPGTPSPSDPNQPPTMPTPPAMPTTPPMPNNGMPASPMTTTDPNAMLYASPAPAPAEKKKEPGRGDFDAGGQVRLPNGPDEDGAYATFNWIAFDMKARYFLLDQITVNANSPLAVKKPDTIEMGAVDPRLIGGMNVRLDAVISGDGFPMMRKGTKIGLSLGAAYMREGAMLLSEKDFPLFVGDFKPGLTGALITKVKLGNVVDFSLTPALIYQSGTMESLNAVQVPMALILKLGDVAKVSAELAVNTGDNYSFSGDKGGRIATGAALDLKIGPMLLHAGAGVASLLTGGAYPTISDSFYIDLNAKYAK
jgi:hypothetical protein